MIVQRKKQRKAEIVVSESMCPSDSASVRAVRIREAVSDHSGPGADEETGRGYEHDG